jgi:hypothetical protein
VADEDPPAGAGRDVHVVKSNRVIGDDLEARPCSVQGGFVNPISRPGEQRGSSPNRFTVSVGRQNRA